MIFSVKDKELGKIPQIGPPWKLHKTREKAHKAPPRVGEHDETVYREWLGMAQTDLEVLRESGVIRKKKNESDIN